MERVQFSEMITDTSGMDNETSVPQIEGDYSDREDSLLLLGHPYAISYDHVKAKSSKKTKHFQARRGGSEWQRGVLNHDRAEN